jgi:hypothetical protein|nr:MAG TPA: putative metal-binding protein [Caudoviricetes sp.]
MKLTVKAALLRERQQMRKRRFLHEMETIYADNICPVCHCRHMTGIVCRRHRGSVCERHCLECEYHVPIYWRCSYKETEQIDMKQWRLIYSHSDKDNLWRGIYRRELIRHDEAISVTGIKSDDPAWVEAVTRATETVMQRAEPKYIIGDMQDENGDYTLIDADTGEIMPFSVKHLENADAWACIQYVDVGA